MKTETCKRGLSFEGFHNSFVIDHRLYIYIPSPNIIGCPHLFFEIRINPIDQTINVPSQYPMQEWWRETLINQKVYFHVKINEGRTKFGRNASTSL